MRIGTVELGKRPTVVLVPNWEELGKELERARELKLDLIEARVDLMEESKIEENLNLIADFGFYAILTVRPTWEGGKFKGTEEERLFLFKELIKHPAVGAVDLELNSQLEGELLPLIKSWGRKLMISYHDFEKTPKDEEIENLFKRAVEKGADLVKMAFTAREKEDPARLSSLMLRLNYPKVFMSMGEKGKFTRVVGFSFGSLLTYTFFGKPVAPGQIEVERLVKLLMEFYPEYRREKEKFLSTVYNLRYGT